MFSEKLKLVAHKHHSYPGLEYVKQDMKTGEFIASDSMIMLIENNGAIPMFEFWDTITQTPVMDAVEYPDVEEAINVNYREAKKYFNVEDVVCKDGFAFLGDLVISERYYHIVRDFIGEEMRIAVPLDRVHGVFFHNADDTLKAFIMVYNVAPKDVKKAVWEVYDTSGTIIYTTKNIQEAEMFGGLVKLKKD